MKITAILQLLLVGLLHQSCQQDRHELTSGLISGFPNTLDLSGIPEKSKDRSVYSFSDLGAWHSYSLSPQPSGGFVGPFLMTDDNGVWASQQLITLNLSINDQPLDWGSAQMLESIYLPGQLVQSYQLDSLIITQRLVFVSKRSTLVQFEIVSLNKQPKVNAFFQGKTWLTDWKFSNQNGGLRLNSSESQTQVIITFPEDFEGSIDRGTFSSEKETFNLNSNFPVKLCYVQSAYFTKEEKNEDREIVEQALSNPKWSLEKNNSRWTDYIEKTLTQIDGQQIDSVYSFLAIKSLNTLTNNWRSAAGELKHDGLFPSYAYGGFHGFWAWDSWKHAVGLADIIPELAKDQILTMYDYQDIDGMIADCIFRDTLIEKHNWRDTKPPLSGWAIAKVFEATGDTAFVRDLYPKLEKYHQWWYKYRDNDGNGLCEYGSTDGTRVAAAWESGMDNAVRFDEATMMTNDGGGYSLNQESVDLNAYLQVEKIYLAQLAKVLGKKNEDQKYTKEAEHLAGLIRDKFYFENEGYFFDVMLDGKMIDVYGPEGWIPLWAGLATEEQAQNLVEKIMDESKFNTLVPLPTLDASHTKFNAKNGYWRGPVWLDQVYFAIRGLEKYGYQTEADLLKNKLTQNAEGLLTDIPIRENYHPITGQGLNAKHFSWSAAHLLMLIRE
ncbi:trehalase family glycosidase [Reichenbachiella sp.]|uniref:MGH1-like glycoside hydrolase domain-containing protein n=1 Tax=Reichenbachiella sp. TaxID=2184521 RepID=UPI003296D834